MAMRHRLSSVVCQELADAKYAADRLIKRIDEITVDGVVTADELRDVLADEALLRKEMQEAVVASEQHDLVMAEFEYRLKVGMGVPVHQYLRQKQQDVAALLRPDEDPKPASTMTLRLVARKRKPIPKVSNGTGRRTVEPRG